MLHIIGGDFSIAAAVGQFSSGTMCDFIVRFFAWLIPKHYSNHSDDRVINDISVATTAANQIAADDAEQLWDRVSNVSFNKLIHVIDVSIDLSFF
jgi:hypothetical protein